MTREQAIKKVQACLRLAASSNPHESATALRQARALMDKYGLNELDARCSDVGEGVAPTRYRGGPVPTSLAMLASVVAAGYRCSTIVLRTQDHDGGKTTFRFFGVGADAEIAAYAFTVLRRRLEADKTRHVRRVRKRANRDVRAEEFALGWVRAIGRLFEPATLHDDQRQLIDEAVRLMHGEVSAFTGRRLPASGRANDGDRAAGWRAGADVQLHQGLQQSHLQLEAQ